MEVTLDDITCKKKISRSNIKNENSENVLTQGCARFAEDFTFSS